MPEKIKYWWSNDRQWFCLKINDGTCEATISLTVTEAEALMDEVMQTPSYIELERECRERAVAMATGKMVECPACRNAIQEHVCKVCSGIGEVPETVAADFSPQSP